MSGSTRKSKRKILKYLETNENENTTIQNLWDIAKAVLRGKLIAIQVYLKKQEKSQVRNTEWAMKEYFRGVHLDHGQSPSRRKGYLRSILKRSSS